MHIQTRSCAAAAVAALAIATAATAETQHTIRLTRPVEVGHRYHVRATANTDLATTAVKDGGSETMDTLKMTVTFDAIANVIKVDDVGRAVGIAYAVNECKLNRHGHVTTIIPAGQTLIARQGEDGRTRFFVKKMRFTELEQHALETIAMIDTYKESKDELFGSGSARAVGERWPIDSEKLAAEFQRYTSHPIDPGDIDGSSSLVDVIDYDGTPCQVIRTDMDVAGPLPGFDQMPPGTRLKSAHLKATTHDLLPVDTAGPRLADKLRVDLDIVFAGRTGGRDVEGRVRGVIDSEHTYSPVASERAAVEP